jgi:hypothetical protein
MAVIATSLVDVFRLGATIQTPYSVSGQFPIDTRMVLKNYAVLQQLTASVCYPGMMVYIAENTLDQSGAPLDTYAGSYFRYTGTDKTVAWTQWFDISSYGKFTTALADIANLKSSFSADTVVAMTGRTFNNIGEPVLVTTGVADPNGYNSTNPCFYIKTAANTIEKWLPLSAYSDIYGKSGSLGVKKTVENILSSYTVGTESDLNTLKTSLNSFIYNGMMTYVTDTATIYIWTVSGTTRTYKAWFKLSSIDEFSTLKSNVGTPNDTSDAATVYGKIAKLRVDMGLPADTREVVPSTAFSRIRALELDLGTVNDASSVTSTAFGRIKKLREENDVALVKFQRDHGIKATIATMNAIPAADRVLGGIVFVAETSRHYRCIQGESARIFISVPDDIPEMLDDGVDIIFRREPSDGYSANTVAVASFTKVLPAGRVLDDYYRLEMMLVIDTSSYGYFPMSMSSNPAERLRHISNPQGPWSGLTCHGSFTFGHYNAGLCAMKYNDATRTIYTVLATIAGTVLEVRGYRSPTGRGAILPSKSKANV